ncbi:MAG: hypothetical protein AAGA54_33380 [Myxococcota bacterium]
MKRLILSLALVAAGCSSGKLMRYVPPDTRTDLTFNPATPERTQLDNGIGVLSSTFEHPATTTLALVFARGYVHDRVPGTAKLLGEWLQLEADTNLSPGLDAVGAAVSTSVGTTSTRLMVTVEHQDVPAAMKALAQLLLHADSELAFEAAKGHRLGAIASYRQNPAALAHLAIVQSTYGPSTSAFDSQGMGTRESLASISFDDLKAARNDMAVSASACWLIVGPQTQNDAYAWAVDATGGWGRRPPPTATTIPVAKQPGVVTFVPLRNFNTATILVGTGVPPHPTPALQLVASAAAGRSNHAMRELAQQTYGAHYAGLDDGPLSLLGVTARVPHEHAKDAAGFMVRSFADVRTLTEWELDYGTTREVVGAYAQRGLATAHVNRLHEAFERGYTFAVGAPFQALPTMPGPEQVMEAYRMHFLMKQLHVVIVGDPDVIEPHLKDVTHIVRTPEQILGPQRPAPEDLPSPTQDEGEGMPSPFEPEGASALD